MTTRKSYLINLTLLFTVLLLMTTACSATVKEIPLGATQINEIESITYKGKGGSSDFLYSENWYWEKNPAFPLDQEDAGEAIQRLESITVVEQLAEIENLVDYGLRRPDYNITLNAKDGTSKTILIGSETEEDHFYATDETKEVVYVIDGEIEDALEFLEETLTQIYLLDSISSPTQ